MALEELRGSPLPRLEVVPQGAASYELGDEAVELAASAGLHLMAWQARMIHYAMAERWDAEHGCFVFAARTVVIIVARQNGKGGVLEARQLAGLFLLERELAVHTAHLFDTSEEHFGRIESLIQNTPDLLQRVNKIVHAHNAEGIELKAIPTLILGPGNVRHGRRPRLRFKARTRDAARGFSAPDLYLDEAMILRPESISAVVPTQSAMFNSQIWFTGSAGDEESVQLGLLRRRALKAIEGDGDEPTMYFAEYSVDEENYDREDPASLVPANPALGLMIDPGWVLTEEKPIFARPEEWDRERLGVGRYPVDPEAARLIPKDLWDALKLADDKVMRPPTGPVAMAVAVRPNRSWSSIGVAWRDGNVDVIDVIETRRGTAWLVDRVRQLREKHSPVAVVIDDHGPGSTLIEDFDEAGVEINPMGLEDYIDACSSLYDDMTEPRDVLVMHRGHGGLTAAAAAAEPRNVGDRWVFGRKGSTDITPLEAATWARKALVDHIAALSAEPVWAFYA